MIIFIKTKIPIFKTLTSFHFYPDPTYSVFYKEGIKNYYSDTENIEKMTRRS